MNGHNDAVDAHLPIRLLPVDSMHPEGHPAHGGTVELPFCYQPIEPGFDASGVGMLGSVLESLALQRDEVSPDVVWCDLLR